MVKRRPPASSRVVNNITKNKVSVFITVPPFSEWMRLALLELSVSSRTALLRQCSAFRSPLALSVAGQRSAASPLVLASRTLHGWSIHWIKSCPRVGRVEREVQVHIRRFVLAQVAEHRHPAPVRQGRRAHRDRCTLGDLPDELRPVNARGERAQRWDGSLQKLLRIGIWPGRAVADV